MGRNKRNTNFDYSTFRNGLTYNQYFQRLWELAISIFEWKGLPDTVDERYIEQGLFMNGQMLYHRDEVMGDICTDFNAGGKYNIYGYPNIRQAYSRFNDYNRTLTDSDSVVIYNNMLRTNSASVLFEFAERLYNLDRVIDVNANAQKTPVFVQATEKQRLTMLNLYKEYDGNAPVIFGDKNIDLNGMKAIKTDAPFVADRIYELKTQIWNEALTYLGIYNVSVQKKERMITDEVNRAQGGTVAARFSRLQSRRVACEKINKMFGTDISVDFRLDNEPMSMPGDTNVEGGDLQDE